MPGFDEATKEIARKIAHHGYTAIMPDLHFREGKGSSEANSASVREAGGMPDDRTLGDVEGAAAYLRTLPTHNGKIGVIGYCSGGRCNASVNKLCSRSQRSASICEPMAQGASCSALASSRLSQAREKAQSRFTVISETSDETPPEFHSLVFDPLSVKDGEYVNVRMVAEDDLPRRRRRRKSGRRYGGRPGSRQTGQCWRCPGR